MFLIKKKIIGKIYTLLLEGDKQRVIFEVLKNGSLIKAVFFPLSPTPNVAREQMKQAKKKFKEEYEIYNKYKIIESDDSLSNKINKGDDKNAVSK